VRWYFVLQELGDQAVQERKKEGKNDHLLRRHNGAQMRGDRTRRYTAGWLLVVTACPIVGSSGPTKPPAGRVLSPDDAPVINDGFAGAAENRETSLTIRDRSRIMHASLFRPVVSLNTAQSRKVCNNKRREITSFSKICNKFQLTNLLSVIRPRTFNLVRY